MVLGSGHLARRGQERAVRWIGAGTLPVTALFIAFAPTENPRIAVSVIVENGTSGSRVAAPMARAMMDRYLGEETSAL